LGVLAAHPADFPIGYSIKVRPGAHLFIDHLPSNRRKLSFHSPAHSTSFILAFKMCERKSTSPDAILSVDFQFFQ